MGISPAMLARQPGMAIDELAGRRTGQNREGRSAATKQPGARDGALANEGRTSIVASVFPGMASD
jgi:hypothetical protein